MDAESLAHEIAELEKSRLRLVRLAGQYPVLGETILMLATTIDNAATTLGILIETKIPGRLRSRT